VSVSFLGGMADAAAWGSVVSILMKLFPAHVTTIASWTEMLLGLGYMLGKDFYCTGLGNMLGKDFYWIKESNMLGKDFYWIG
jgi:hypothetical protein